MYLYKFPIGIMSLLTLDALALLPNHQVLAHLGSRACTPAAPQEAIPGAQSTNQSICSGGRLRSYLLHFPNNYDPSTPAPLILSFHGNNRNASEQEALSQFSNATFNQHSIAIYPQGHHGHWQGAPYATPGIDDLQFISDLLAAVQSTYSIDPTRIYAAGKSNGGGFVSALACSPILSGQIAAFAPVSGAFYENAAGTTPLDGPCTPNTTRTSIPILEFHGQDDCTIPYTGGAHNTCGVQKALPPIPTWLEGWARKNGCAAHTVGNSSVEFGGAVNRTTWRCGGGEEVVTGYWVRGLEHWWPSTQPNDDNPDHATVLDATKVIMEFFGKRTLP